MYKDTEANNFLYFNKKEAFVIFLSNQHKKEMVHIKERALEKALVTWVMRIFVPKMNVGTRQNKGAKSNVMFVEKNPTMYTLKPRHSRVFERVFLFAESSIYLV